MRSTVAELRFKCSVSLTEICNDLHDLSVPISYDIKITLSLDDFTCVPGNAKIFNFKIHFNIILSGGPN